MDSIKEHNGKTSSQRIGFYVGMVLIGITVVNANILAHTIKEPLDLVQIGLMIGAVMAGNATIYAAKSINSKSTINEK